MVLKIWRATLGFLFPCECKICEGPLGVAKWVCEGCLTRIKHISLPQCHLCGIPLAPFFLDIVEPLCKECRSQPRYFHQARAVAFYGGVTKESLHLFKYGRKIALYKPLGQLMTDLAATHWRREIIDLIVPVPLHPKRKRERGFNQAELLAFPIKTRLKLPIDTKNFIRDRATQTQTELGKKERIENVKGAFRVRGTSQFSGKNILLVDDIFTTGATLNECSRTLIEAGARRIYALTLARVV